MRFGDVEVLEQVAAGASGTVFRARELSLAVRTVDFCTATARSLAEQ